MATRHCLRAGPGSYEVCSVCHWLDDPIQFGLE
ncbi:CPCC family cysteine-rich protein [Proteus mirabilis]